MGARRWTPAAAAVIAPRMVVAILAVALLSAASLAAASDLDVVVSEVNYHPFGVHEPTFEFIELHNRGSSPVNLGGWSFRQGIGFTFPAGLFI
ncbi:MAG TPA: lamin tail domain-containing protein, partial [Planctomycetota bacterium]|nr:lamin tail domain-containing protein [Planctomycetota bacterium]